MSSTSYRQLTVHTLSTDIRKATRMTTHKLSDLEKLVKSSEVPLVLIRAHYLGMNASDINFTAGRYDPTVKPPFVAGFEGMGEVVLASDKCQYLRTGTPVVYAMMGAFAEYVVLPEHMVVPLPAMEPKYFGLLVSGQTAALALKHSGHLKKGDIVLVTAAAGGAGQIAVQWAKLHGASMVIGTCSTEKKAAMLKKLGCDHVIVYTKENVKEALKKLAPRGLDVVFESVGGEMFKTAVNALAFRGRLIVIGSISTYKQGDVQSVAMWADQVDTVRLVQKSATVAGFFLSHFAEEMKEVLPELMQLIQQGKMKILVDTDKFMGLESVAEATDFLHSGKNMGKVVVPMFPSKNARL